MEFKNTTPDGVRVESLTGNHEAEAIIHKISFLLADKNFTEKLSYELNKRGLSVEQITGSNFMESLDQEKRQAVSACIADIRMNGINNEDIKALVNALA